ncbi:tyrosine-type recombinase/integrase [Paenirhodobacter populi]|uniref:tyrosine-type recombinase/integrase n=1 Tax=Paenirhodobacter populi TaxID=2306993 RepID=UPI0013E361B2|nr:tyrosine-type recombinase/integrase [Sinirhodobacter populi]
MKGLSQTGRWPSGNPRFYLRLPGKKAIPMPDRPKSHPEFLSAYVAATGGKTIPPHRPGPGTIGAAVVAFMSSAAFHNLSGSTKAYMRRNLEAIRRTWGNAKTADLESRHIRADLSKLEPHPANTRLRAWRALCKWAFNEAALMDNDPAAPVARRVTPKSDGHKTWTRDEVAAFRHRWGYGTKQRLAFELIHRTGAAIVDACKLGPGMVRDGWLHYRRQKSGSDAVCPMTAVASPAWFEHDDHLDKCLSAHPRHMSYIVTASGAPRSHKASSQWFAAACRDAGLEGLSAHGLRKHRASVFQENGATEDQRMAILGHETASEARHYSKAADLKKTVTGTAFSNSEAKLPTSASK